MLDRQLAAISLAVNHATVEDIDRGAAIMEGITILGTSVYDRCPFVLAGLAYVAGIAEGKQSERNRRRHAAAKEGR